MQDTQKEYHQFFSARPVIGIVMPSGKRLKFIGGTYVTDAVDEIEFLNGQIAQGHSLLSVRKGQETVTADALDPLAAVKKRAVEEYLAQQALNSNPNRDMGNTSSDVHGSMQTSKSIQPIAVGSKSK